MFYWLFIVILAYFFFGLSSLGDKLILNGPPKPKAYTFFVSIFGASAVILIPFINFGLPGKTALLWIISEAIVYILSLYVSYTAIEKFDLSKVAITIGATQPIFIFVLTCLFWGFQEISALNILAFIILLSGSIIASVEKGFKIINGYLKITIFASFLFSLDYVLSKIIFLDQPFLQGLIYMRFFAAIFAIVFLISKTSRKEIFEKNIIANRKTDFLFFLTQATGGTAAILQNFAIYLVPIAFLPILNSLRGVQYIFIFALILILSIFSPKILKENISKKIAIQKIISIVLIAVGLAIISL